MQNTRIINWPEGTPSRVRPTLSMGGRGSTLHCPLALLSPASGSHSPQRAAVAAVAVVRPRTIPTASRTSLTQTATTLTTLSLALRAT